MEDHQSLADFVKGVHINLRINSRKMGTNAAWELHCSDVELLKKYGSAMQQLATSCWDDNNKQQDIDSSRISWIVKYSEKYFKNNWSKDCLENEKKLGIRYGFPVMGVETEIREEGLKLLDVGSCYNPFGSFRLFDVTAIDLAPASDQVLKCDFLSVKIGSECQTVKTECQQLPHNSFDIVVFSLFLDYLPCPKQRFTSCQKAYDLLKKGGVLFIISPDSKHATANSKIIKLWRFVLASLGFLRINYEKLKHLHCMMFRKCYTSSVPQHWLSLQKYESTSLPDGLIIPQDKNDYTDSALGTKPNTTYKCDADNNNVAQFFNYLIHNEDIFN